MEYFYDEVFKRKMVTDLKNKITHPDFSYKDEDKIYEIAMFVKNRLRMNDETGQGNELESLKYVLNEYVSVDDLKARINIIDSKSDIIKKIIIGPKCKINIRDMKILLRKYHYINDMESNSIEIVKSNCPYT